MAAWIEVVEAAPFSAETHMDLLDALEIALKGPIRDGTVVCIRPANYSYTGADGRLMPVFIIDIDAPDPMVHLKLIAKALYAAELHNALRIELQPAFRARRR